MARAEQRIKQLISKQRVLLDQAAYMQRVAEQMIPLLPKQVVAHILEAAKETSQPTN